MDAALRQELSQGRSLRLWMSDQQWMNLLEQVERAAREYTQAHPDGPERRGGDRAPYTIRCAIRTQTPDGQSATYVVQSRNISSGGLGFLTHQHLEPRTRCTVAIQGPEGQGLIASASIAWCREIQADANEVGIQFDQPIDITAFTGEDHPASA